MFFWCPIAACRPSGRAGAMRRRQVSTTHSSLLVSLDFEAANVIDNRLAPAIDVRPGAIADTIARTRYVDHVAACLRRRHTVMRLLIGDHDDAVIRRAQAGQRVAQLCSTVRLAGYNRIAQRKAAT